MSQKTLALVATMQQSENPKSAEMVKQYLEESDVGQFTELSDYEIAKKKAHKFGAVVQIMQKRHSGKKTF